MGIFLSLKTKTEASVVVCLPSMLRPWAPSSALQRKTLETIKRTRGYWEFTGWAKTLCASGPAHRAGLDQGSVSHTLLGLELKNCPALSRSPCPLERKNMSRGLGSQINYVKQTGTGIKRRQFLSSSRLAQSESDAQYCCGLRGRRALTFGAVGRQVTGHID